MLMKKRRKTRKKRKKEKGCTEPLFGKKAKCIIKIVPKDKKVKTFQMDQQCIKKRNLG
jgi:ribosomal protein S26